MARVSEITLLFSTRQTRVKPLIHFEEFSGFFGMATVFELGMARGASVTFLSASTSDDRINRRAGGVSRMVYALMGLQPAAPRGSRVRARRLDQTEPLRHESEDRRAVDDAHHRLTRLHFCPGSGAIAGYLARSACHFLASSGLFVAV